MPKLEFTQSGCESVLDGLNNKISCGFDSVNNRLLKLCKPEIATLMCILGNQIAKQSYWPDIFKNVKAIVLHKKNDVRDPDNYRVIALLSCLSKCLEKVMHEHLLNHFEKNKLFSSFQAGFRENHSCDDITADLLDTVLSNKKKKLFQSILFLDFKRAFDYMSIERLLIKLKGYKCSSTFTQLIKSYLTNRSFTFLVNGHLSSIACTLFSGCSQGSCLGPLLFIIFINDLDYDIAEQTRARSNKIIRTAKQNKLSKHLTAKQTAKKKDLEELLKEKDKKFADDVGQLIASLTIKGLKNAANKAALRLEEWANDNNMIISIEKTKIMTISPTQKFIPNFDVKIYNQSIEFVNNFRYLGQIIDTNLTGKGHLNHVIDKVNSVLSRIQALKSQLSMEKLLQISECFAYPHVHQGWKAIYPLMNITMKEKWIAASRKIQKVSLNLPQYTPNEMVNAISPIRDLTNTINQFLLRDAVRYLSDPTFKNSFTEKIKPIEYQVATRHAKNVNFQIQSHHKKSTVTAVAEFIDKANLKSATDIGKIYECFIPKLSIQLIDTRLPEKDKLVLRHLSCGLFSRKFINGLDYTINKNCIDCLRFKSPKTEVTEDTTHLLSCSELGQDLVEQAKPYVADMLEATHKRLNSITFPLTIRHCTYLLNKTIHSDEIDFILGIGKVQLLKDVCGKTYKKISKVPPTMQGNIIDILRSKNRLTLKYTQRIENLYKEQISRYPK